MRLTLLLLLISSSVLAQEKRYFTRETFQIMTDQQTGFVRHYSSAGDSVVISDYMNDVLILQATIYRASNLEVIIGTMSIPRVNEFMIYCRSRGAEHFYRPYFQKIRASVKLYLGGNPESEMVVRDKQFKYSQKWISPQAFAPRTAILTNGTGEYMNGIQHESFKDSILVKSYHLTLTEKTDTIYDHVDVPATPKDGLEKFSSELTEVLHYPLYARFLGKQGTAYIEFVVNENGQLTSFRQLYYDGGNFEKEVLKALSKLKPWTPAMFRGRAVKTQFRMPITFKLTPAQN